MFAAFFNFVAIFVFHLSVAATVGKGIVEPGVVDHHVVFGALIGAIAWNLITWWYGIPSQLVARADRRPRRRGDRQGRRRRADRGRHLEDGALHLPLAAARLRARLAADGAGRLALPARHAARASTAGSGACSSSRPALYSLGHGGNDAQKTIGIIWMLLIAAGYADAPTRRAADLGDRGAATSRSALGTLFGGWRIVKTMGQKITKLKPVGGFCAETGGAITLFLATALGIPVSTTHTITGAIVGVGSAQRASRGALGRGGQHRVGVDLHDPGLGLRGGDRLLAEPAAVLKTAIGNDAAVGLESMQYAR